MAIFLCCFHHESCQLSRSYGHLPTFSWGQYVYLYRCTPQRKRVLAQTFQQEGLSVAKQQMISSKHTVDATSKSMASSVAHWHFSWLRGLAEDACARIEDLPYDGVGLFNAEMDNILENIQNGFCGETMRHCELDGWNIIAHKLDARMFQYCLPLSNTATCHCKVALGNLGDATGQTSDLGD